MNSKLLLAFVISGFLLVNAQPINEENIARIGTNDISIKEFLYRYELTPQLYRENGNIKQELKKEFLYSLAAEKLLALYAEDSSVDTIEIVRNTIKSYEEMFVRDALYKKEIASKSVEKEDSLLDIYLAGASKVFVIYLSSVNEEQANILYERLAAGVSFDSLYSELPDGAKDTLMLIRGQLDEKTEGDIFGLNNNSFSRPVCITDAWYIFKILSGTNPVLEKSRGWDSEYKYLQKLAKERAEYEFYKSYMLLFFNNANVQSNAKLMKSLGKEIYKILESKKIDSDLPQKVYLETYDLLKIKKILGPDTTSMVYIKYPDKEILLNEFIDFFRFENFFVDTLDYRKVLGVLNGKTKQYIEHKLLTEEGYRQGLQNLNEVQENLKMWKENYYSQLVTGEFMDSARVSDNELKEYLNKTKKGKYSIKKVNVIELKTDSLEIAGHVLSKLNEGEDFEDLVKVYSNDHVEENMESGYFPVTSKGEIGRLADKMNIGDVYGPIEYKKGYVIFKLIGVKEDSLKYPDNINEVDESIKQELKYSKSREAYNQFIAKLADKYSFSINEEWLDKISVTSMYSLIYNYLGFGGRILAVPLLKANMEWQRYWENIQNNP
jgi:parvulin-like peptidyl-prolyl isomerase